MTPHRWENEAEEAVIGVLLLTGEVNRVRDDFGLHPEHFYNEALGLVYRAMLEATSAGDHVDRLTVKSILHRLDADGKLPQGQVWVEALAACPPVSGNLQTYVRRVLEAAAWRDDYELLRRLNRAHRARDRRAWDEAMSGAANVIPIRGRAA